MTNFEMVREFHEVFGTVDPTNPVVPSQDIIDLRLKLINEEHKEVAEAIASGNLMDIAKELSDLLYVVYGTGLAFGIPLDRAFQEVHRSNMSKLGSDGKPIYREDGKVLKGPNYTEADLSFIMDT